MMKKRAILSVSDKSGLAELAQALIGFDFELFGSGGTGQYLREHDIPCTPIEELTDFAECLGGRVKTLHPAIHAGLLARKDVAADCQDLQRLSYGFIDLLVCNLYPFQATRLAQDSSYQQILENIDIGGVTLLRSAAKNHVQVAVLCDPSDYSAFVQAYQPETGLPATTRLSLAAKAFAHCADYDAQISAWFAHLTAEQTKPEPELLFPENIAFKYEKVTELRYGENPQQKAALYAAANTSNSLLDAKLIQGKPMSYNNYVDADAALAVLAEFSEPTVVVVKHTNPCAVASSDNIEQAFAAAHAADPVSIFGGIVAQNRAVSLVEAEALAHIFLEIIIAPSFSTEALQLLGQKKNLRLLALEQAGAIPVTVPSFREISGGILLQERDSQDIAAETLLQTTTASAAANELGDYIFAMRVCRHVKSNAIVLVKERQTIGIGMGQANRVQAVELALKQAGSKAKGAIMASDAFFPFADSVALAAAAGVKGIIQPGGSLRDQDSIDLCNQHQMVMLFTKHRHFRH